MLAHLARVRRRGARPRSASSVASIESRYAARGTLASTITTFPPGRRTIRSGRSLPSSRGRRHLLVEVAVRQHSGQLDDALELDLPQRPRTCGVRRAVASDAVRSLSLRELLTERAIRSLARQLERPHLAVHLLERILQRPDVAGQLGLGDLQERTNCLPGTRRRTRLDRGHDLLVERPALVVGSARVPASSRLEPTPKRLRGVQPHSDAPRRRPSMRARMTIGPTNARDGVGRRQTSPR